MAVELKRHNVHLIQHIPAPKSWGGRGLIKQSLCGEREISAGHLTNAPARVTCSLCKIKMNKLEWVE